MGHLKKISNKSMVWWYGLMIWLAIYEPYICLKEISNKSMQINLDESYFSMKDLLHNIIIIYT